MLIYFVPLILALWAFSPEISIEQLLELAVAATVIYVFYELGYLENDVVTVRMEQDPTLRLSPEQGEYVMAHVPAILISRVLLGAGGLWLLKETPGFVWFLVALCFLILVFATYNRVRGKLNALLHPILVTIRYCGPLIVLVPEIDLLIYGFLLFPLINSLERAAEPRYEIAELQSLWFTNQVSGRWSYYAALSLGVAAYVHLTGESWALLVPVMYLFSYRVLTAVLRPHKVQT